MDRFNANEEKEITPLEIAKDIIFSDASKEKQVEQIVSAITKIQDDLKRKHRTDLADAQLFGFFEGKNTGHVLHMIQTMNITLDDWETLKVDYPTIGNIDNTDDIEIVDEYFKKKRKPHFFIDESPHLMDEDQREKLLKNIDKGIFILCDELANLIDDNRMNEFLNSIQTVRKIKAKLNTPYSGYTDILLKDRKGNKWIAEIIDSGEIIEINDNEFTIN